MTTHGAFVRILLLLSLFLSSVTASAQGVEDVSILQLIATPEKFDGKMILVIGFLRLEHEGNVLYLHEDDYKHGISKNGVWIVTTDEIRKRAAQLNMRYVLVKGTFKSSDKGHISPNSGSITNITNVELWPPEKGISRPK